MAAIAVSRRGSRACDPKPRTEGEGGSYKTVSESLTNGSRNGGRIIDMTFGWSLLALGVVFALIGVLAMAGFAPRRKSRVRQDKVSKALPDPISDPPTITHYGHA